MDHLERVRRICCALPDVTEKVAWGAPTFRVRGKLFAMFADDHHGDGRIALWCHSDLASQRLLVDSDPRRFFVPPYVGCKGWVGICVDRSNDALLVDCVAKAHGTAAPKPKRRKTRTGGPPAQSDVVRARVPGRKKGDVKKDRSVP